MFYIHRLFWILLIVAVTSPPLVARPEQRTSSSAQRQSSNTRTREIQAKLNEANRHLRLDPKRALAILKRLNRRFPNEPVVLARLGLVYQAINEEDSANVMFNLCLKKDRINLEAGKALGLLYYSQGEEEKAQEHFDRFLKESRYSMQAYRMVGAALTEVGLYDRALDIYRDGRTRSKSHYRLTLFIADLEKAMGNSAVALSEYLDYVDMFPDNYQVVKQKVDQLFQDSKGAGSTKEEWDALLTLAEEKVHASKNAPREILDVLSGVYLKIGLPEKALDAALEADLGKWSDGRTLYSLAGGFLSRYLDQPAENRRRYYDLSILALDAYSARYPRSVQTPQAMYQRASLYADAAGGKVSGFTASERETLFETSLLALDDIFTRFPASQEAALAALKKGDLLFEVRNLPREALAVYETGMKHARSVPGLFAEKIGRMYLVLGEYDLARRHFEKFIRSSNKERRQAGIYYLGMLLCFIDEYAAAKDTLTFLAKEDPASRFTNDAIELAWVIDEGMQSDEKMLTRFIEVLKAELALDTAAVVEKLESFNAGGTGTVLRPRALYKLGEVYAQTGKFELALARLRTFLDEYERHDLRPDVHRAIGRVYEHGLGDRELARREYENILLKYPNYIFLDEVRVDITRLEPGEKEDV